MTKRRAGALTEIKKEKATNKTIIRFNYVFEYTYNTIYFENLFAFLIRDSYTRNIRSKCKGRFKYISYNNQVDKYWKVKAKEIIKRNLFLNRKDIESENDHTIVDCKIFDINVQKFEGSDIGLFEDDNVEKSSSYDIEYIEGEDIFNNGNNGNKFVFVEDLATKYLRKKKKLY